MRVSINTRPSIRFVRILPVASGCLEIPSDALPIAIPIAIAPAAAAKPTANAAGHAFDSVDPSASVSLVSSDAAISESTVSN